MKITDEKIAAANKEFYRILKQQRIVAGLSQNQLADLCGWDRREVSSLENGKRNASIATVNTYLLGCKRILKIN